MNKKNVPLKDFVTLEQLRVRIERYLEVPFQDGELEAIIHRLANECNTVCFEEVSSNTYVLERQINPFLKIPFCKDRGVKRYHPILESFVTVDLPERMDECGDYRFGTLALKIAL